MDPFARMLADSGGGMDLFRVEFDDGTLRLLLRFGKRLCFSGGHHLLHWTQLINSKFPLQAKLGRWVPGLFNIISKQAFMNTHYESSNRTFRSNARCNGDPWGFFW